MRRRWYVSWVGLRGAVPIVFATYPLLAGVDKANFIFNIVFFVSLSSVIIQGTTLSIVAKWLHVALPERVKPKSQVETFLSDGAKSIIREILIPENNNAVGKRIVELGFPKKAIIAMISRNEQFITPKGTTAIEANDILIILSEDERTMTQVYDTLELKEELEEIE